MAKHIYVIIIFFSIISMGMGDDGKTKKNVGEIDSAVVDNMLARANKAIQDQCEQKNNNWLPPSPNVNNADGIFFENINEVSHEQQNNYWLEFSQNVNNTEVIFPTADIDTTQNLLESILDVPSYEDFLKENGKELPNPLRRSACFRVERDESTPVVCPIYPHKGNRARWKFNVSLLVQDNNLKIACLPIRHEKLGEIASFESVDDFIRGDDAWKDYAETFEFVKFERRQNNKLNNKSPQAPIPIFYSMPISIEVSLGRTRCLNPQKGRKYSFKNGLPIYILFMLLDGKGVIYDTNCQWVEPTNRQGNSARNHAKKQENNDFQISIQKPLSFQIFDGYVLYSQFIESIAKSNLQSFNETNNHQPPIDYEPKDVILNNNQFRLVVFGENPIFEKIVPPFFMVMGWDKARRTVTNIIRRSKGFINFQVTFSDVISDQETLKAYLLYMDEGRLQNFELGDIKVFLRQF